MCGIVGYIGAKNTTDILLNGLRRLEYRGYDSAGVALLEAGKLNIYKKSGKVEKLNAELAKKVHRAGSGIAHTRWATHGEPNQKNAHPHTSGSFAIVHNGIIENYREIKASLLKSGVKFQSETDSEVLAHLIAREYEQSQNLVSAVTLALKRVVGSFGLAIISSEEPGHIVAARRGSPLLLGVGDDEMFIASDAAAIIGHTNQIVYLEDDEVALCTSNSYKISDLENLERQRQVQTVDLKLEMIEKSGYDHFLIKEIMEQPKTLQDLLTGKLDFERGTTRPGGINISDQAAREIERFLVIGCGTAYYAGLVGKYLLERLTDIPVDVEFASEFRYRDPALRPNTEGIILSQSGETADTLASLHELKQRGVHSLGLVNVVGSSIARAVDGGIYLHAGPEISVASTKAFSAQVTAQLLLGLHIGRHRGLALEEGQELIEALQALPAAIQKVLNQHIHIKAIADKYAHFKKSMYLGRDSLYPVALEGALKLKEISYMQAEAHPSGEMKHGPIALVDKELLVVFLASKNKHYLKAQSNLEEIVSRRGTVVAVTTAGNSDMQKYAQDIIYVPPVSPWIEPIVTNIALQFFAYYVAVARGNDVDKPRNLAKSVTVE